MEIVLVCALGVQGGIISRDKLARRFEVFARGEWNELLNASRLCDELAATARRREKRIKWESCRQHVRLWRAQRWFQARRRVRHSKIRARGHKNHTNCSEYGARHNKFARNVRSAK